jgi:transcription-repair coupling factor (superfamily II helicase)
VTDFKKALAEISRGQSLTLASVPDGFDAFVAADFARLMAGAAHGRAAVLVHVARDGQRARAFEEAFTFAAPDLELLDFPSWDCQPYDRVSPNAAISAKRMLVLSRLARSQSSEERPRVLSTTVNALLQRVPPLKWTAAESFSAAPGNAVNMDELVRWLENNGFLRASSVRETGEYAVRGGILDLFAPGMPAPVRLDFFGDTLESIRAFDPESQRTTGQLRALDLVPMSEVQLTTESMKRFRQAYVTQFGAQTRGDTLYEAISEGRRHVGMEHWLPLFFGGADTLFDYIGGAPLFLDSLAEDAAGERLSQIKDYYDARKEQHDADPARSPYKPLPSDALYLSPEGWRKTLDENVVVRFSPFATPQTKGVFDCEARIGRNFAPERADENANVFEAVVAHVRAAQAQKQRVIIAGWSDGSRDRLASVLGEHGLKGTEPVSSLAQALGVTPAKVALAVAGMEQGFEAGDLVVISEQDILGDRLVRQRRKTRKAADFLSEVASLSAGDLVVHVDHGIGRFVGLQAIDVSGAPHDCLEIHYAGGDKLFLPVENLELLSRYGSEDTEAQLDKLGGVGWQTRKSRMKKRIRDMAQELIKIAAARFTREAPKLSPPENLYEEFCARYTYD